MIRDIEIRSDSKGRVQEVRITFGPHHFLELRADADKVSFAVGATHHGFRADASSVPSELEKLCEEIRRNYPGNCID